MINYHDLCKSVFKDRINNLNQHAAITKHVYKLSKPFIMLDLINALQKELAKHVGKQIVYIADDIVHNYHPSFIIPTSERTSERTSGRTSERTSERATMNFSKKPYRILYDNYDDIYNMLTGMTFFQFHEFSYLHKFMKSCKYYPKEFHLKKLKPKEFEKNFRKGLKWLIAYDSVINNEDLELCERFVAQQFNLDSPNESVNEFSHDSPHESSCESPNESHHDSPNGSSCESPHESPKITWEDIFNYCKRKCFGIALNTDEQYMNYLNNDKSNALLPGYPNEIHLDFDYYSELVNLNI